MANPRRNSFSSSNTQNSETNNPFNIQTSSSCSPFLINFFNRPQAFPLLLSVFVFITWVSLRLQYADFTKTTQKKWSSNVGVGVGVGVGSDDDVKANLVRFKSGFPSGIAKDKRGWLLNPVSLALESGVKGGAVSCVSPHLGEIRPGAIRGNHRHHTVNETFVLWGAKTKFRLENSQIDKGYAEVMVGADEVAVAASPSGSAHALVNIDPVLSTFFLGCQDGVINYNKSTSDFNVWKDL